MHCETQGIIGGIGAQEGFVKLNIIIKRILVICLITCIVFLVLAACSNNSSNVERPDISFLPEETDTNITDVQDIDKPDINIEDIDKDITIFCERTGINDLSEDEIKDWEFYIYDKYDYAIDLIISEKVNLLKTDVGEIIEKTNLDGFVYMYAFWQLDRLIDAEVLMPVNEYIKDIPEYSVMDEKILFGYTDRNNNIWAFPFGKMNDSLPRTTRFYNKEWLEKANVPIPTTIEEFYSYAKFVAEKDPDDDNSVDTYIAAINTAKLPGILESLNDIWVAFGCYFDMGPISYNPETEQYEDFILNEKFINAATFIKYLIDNGYILKYETLTPSEEGPYNVASADVSHIAQTLHFNGYEIGQYLLGENDTYLINIRPPSTCIGVLKNTEKPKEQMQSFLQILQSDPNSFMDFYAGIEGTHYNTTKTSYEIIMPENIDDLNLIFMDLKLNGSEEDIIIKMGEIEEESLFEEMHNKAVQELKGFLTSDIAYSSPYDSYSYGMISLNSSLSQSVEKLFTSIFIAGDSIEDAVNEYKEETEKLGIERKIHTLNNN